MTTKEIKELRKRKNKELKELKKQMSKTEFSKFEKSYHTYTRDWHNWKSKGWAMKTEQPWSATTYYTEYKKAQMAKETNIGSKFASSGRILNKKSATELKNILDKIDSGADEAFDQEIKKKFNTLSKIKRNIGTYQTYIDGETYTAKQAMYLDIKFIYGLTTANEYFGYR